MERIIDAIHKATQALQEVQDEYDLLDENSKEYKKVVESYKNDEELNEMRLGLLMWAEELES
jgi:phosphopantothenate synthetase